METSHFPFIIFLLQFLSLLPSSPAYTPPPIYFMNCGSDSNFSIVGDQYSRNFVGDQNPDSTFFVGDSKPIRSTGPLPGNPSDLYSTARIYRKSSCYELNVNQNGTYFVRLHFFPFSSEGTDLSDASFNVSTSNFLLLSMFSVRNNTSFPVIEEFMLTISIGKFKICFIPAKKTSFAFVNAIEVFLLPANFTSDDALAVPPLVGKDGLLRGLNSKAFKKLYRINVGGSEITASADALLRNWVPDDKYLISGGSAVNESKFDAKLIPIPGAMTVEDIAPDAVYKTCKMVNATNGRATNFSNITWRFDVRILARHLVRVHFCDFLSPSPGEVQFNLYMYTTLMRKIDPNENDVSEMSSPYYYDFEAASDDSGYMNISIAPREDSNSKIAFLNGLEIMEIQMNTTGFAEPNDDKGDKHLFLIIGLVVGIAILTILFLLVLRWTKAKPVKDLVLKTEPSYGRGRSYSWITETTSYTSPVPNLNLKLKMSLAEILDATQNFHTKLLIGEGGFGKVYKGTLKTGIKVAVKRSDLSHGQGRPEFQTEVMILSKIRHRHLVSLIGYCDEGSEMILVYEFMEKGTLRDHLYTWKENSKQTSTQSKLTWKQRLEICIGSAKGLHYLHTGSDRGVLHRDVKSTNILLDEHYVAKVADFGLSQSGAPDSDHFSMGVKGSFGYLDPEYFRTLQLTEKSDVYSFGVVLLEVLCARLPIINSAQREEINLAEWGLSWLKKGQLEKIIDPLLVGCVNLNSLRKFGEIAERCLKPESAERPSMLDVCWDLEYALQLQQTAVQKEPHEDSTTDASSVLVLPTVRRLSSNSYPKEDCSSLSIGADDDSGIMDSGAFPQRRIDDPL